jgi:hypothetical protein
LPGIAFLLGTAFLLDTAFLPETAFLAAVVLFAVFLPSACLAANVAELGNSTPAATTRRTERRDGVLMCMALIG